MYNGSFSTIFQNNLQAIHVICSSTIHSSTAYKYTSIYSFLLISNLFIASHLGPATQETMWLTQKVRKVRKWHIKLSQDRHFKYTVLYNEFHVNQFPFHFVLQMNFSSVSIQYFTLFFCTFCFNGEDTQTSCWHADQFSHVQRIQNMTMHIF